MVNHESVTSVNLISFKIGLADNGITFAAIKANWTENLALSQLAERDVAPW